MISLILAAVMFGIGAGVFVLAFSAAIAFIARNLVGRIDERRLALVTAGIVPLSLPLWTLVDLASHDCCESGPEAQGLLALAIVATLLVVVVWPLGYLVNLAILSDQSQ